MFLSFVMGILIGWLEAVLNQTPSTQVSGLFIVWTLDLPDYLPMADPTRGVLLIVMAMRVVPLQLTTFDRAPRFDK